MNYWKAAIAGFGMSFVGTALCGAKFGTYLHHSYYGRIKKDVSESIFNYADISEAEFVKTLCKDFNLKFEKNKEGIIDRIDWKDFKYDKYYNTYLKEYEKNYWFNNDGNWSVAQAFLRNNAAYIPISLLGALFHDKVGRDLTPKINEAFDIDISPYLVTGGIFGGAVTVVSVAYDFICREYEGIFSPTKPFTHSVVIINAFLIGATAMAGAYFGDEDNDNSGFTEEVI